MNNFVDELKKYFENTPREQVLKDWAESEEFSETGTTFEEFIETQKKYQKVRLKEFENVETTFNNLHDPKFSSGFFISLN